jgi:hypothetical protein
LSQRFVVLSGEERIIYDQDIGAAEDEDRGGSTISDGAVSGISA